MIRPGFYKHLKHEVTFIRSREFQKFLFFISFYFVGTCHVSFNKETDFVYIIDKIDFERCCYLFKKKCHTTLKGLPIF